MRPSLTFLLAAALCAAGAAPVRAQSSEAPTPPADVVSVATHVSFATAVPGGANEGSCLVLNATSGDVRVRLSAAVEFADGATSRLTGNFDPGVLPPDGGFELNIFFVVPPSAALGPALFHCEVSAQSLELRGRPESESSASGFEVVAP